ncbi:MAG: hypothetical protein HC897_15110, partial [Thermoanaerobaculia bacterium]|nr:hypothetical protein [Thermoanaerobaculia bacterium]
EQVISLRRVGRPAIAADGRQIAFEVRTVDWGENRFDTEIWLARDGEEPFQLTRTTKGSSTDPSFSPDGRWLGFLADRGDGRQLYLIRTAGGEAQRLTQGEEGVEEFRFAPDGKTIVFMRSEPEGENAKRAKSASASSRSKTPRPARAISGRSTWSSTLSRLRPRWPVQPRRMTTPNAPACPSHVS